MLTKIKLLKDYKLNSFDGEFGGVKEFYFDDQYWTIRYLVAKTGMWLIGKQVLISPYALISTNKEEQTIMVNLTQKQIEESPSIDSDKPLSRQFETAYFEYYGWPVYWIGPYMWGGYSYLERSPDHAEAPNLEGKMWDYHLRSTDKITGYEIEALDGDIGHVDDFIIDDETWEIRYLVVSTRNWLPGKKVLISPEWIERMSWEESKVFINLTQEDIKNSPEYSEELLLTRDYEFKIYDHYNRTSYWTNLKENVDVKTREHVKL